MFFWSKASNDRFDPAPICGALADPGAFDQWPLLGDLAPGRGAGGGEAQPRPQLVEGRSCFARAVGQGEHPSRPRLPAGASGWARTRLLDRRRPPDDLADERGGWLLPKPTGRRPAHGKVQWSARRPEMAPQRIDMIESALGNSMAQKLSSHKIWVRGRRTLPVDPICRSRAGAMWRKEEDEKDYSPSLRVTP